MLRASLRPGGRPMSTRCWHVRRLLGSALFVFLATLATASAAPVYVWQEGEQPSSANFKFAVQGGPRGNLLSGGKWLHMGLEQADIAAQVPAEGLLLTYNLQAPEAGDYELWARVGYEWVRPPFEWRIGERRVEGRLQPDADDQRHEPDHLGRGRLAEAGRRHAARRAGQRCNCATSRAAATVACCSPWTAWRWCAAASSPRAFSSRARSTTRRRRRQGRRAGLPAPSPG